MTSPPPEKWAGGTSKGEPVKGEPVKLYSKDGGNLHPEQASDSGIWGHF